ncbi:MAG: lysophospholipid acyltransferase family protein [Tissierellia bacterium]|nr:lysophospholipid acyltransferase family protein [Tissierellia bacterium]
MIYNILRFIVGIIFRIIYRIRVHGDQNINDDKLIICANHNSLLDPILLAIVYKRKINFMAKKELFENSFLNWLLIKIGAFPVDRGNADIKAIKKSLSILKDNQVLGIFPEGTRVKDISIENVKAGIGMLASRSKSDILPVSIVGDYKIFSRIDIYFKDIIKIEKYQEIGKDANKIITKDIYNSIYDFKGELVED